MLMVPLAVATPAAAASEPAHWGLNLRTICRGQGSQTDILPSTVTLGGELAQSAETGMPTRLALPYWMSELVHKFAGL